MAWALTSHSSPHSKRESKSKRKTRRERKSCAKKWGVIGTGVLRLLLLSWILSSVDEHVFILKKKEENLVRLIQNKLVSFTFHEEQHP
jgi:hypothetical protein